jgi:Cu-processing system permease protein
MRESLAHIWVMARLTFREAQRRQLLWIGVALGLGFVGLFAFGFSAAYRDMQRQAASRALPELLLEQASNGFMIAGLYVVNFLVVMVTALTAVGSVSSEISSNTVHALAAKPVRRWEILVGKWLGNALMMTLYVLMMAVGVMATVYIIGGFVPPNPLAGIALMLLEGLVMLSVATLGSCVLSTLANGVLVFMLYGIAFVGSWVETFGSFMGSQAAVDLGIASSLLMPSEALWRRAQYLMQTALVRNVASMPFNGSGVPSPAFVVYAGLYMAAMLGAAIWVFSRRDF